jgi:hypothetical protein
VVVTIPLGELGAVFPGADVDDVQVTSIYEPVASASRGIWRVHCGADSAILKLVGHADGNYENWQSGEDVAHWYYWRREVSAYESGWLASLRGGLRAPACRYIASRDDGSVGLWLEDLGGTPAVDWEIARYRTAARHLGQTQGMLLESGSLPDQPWLSRDWLRSYLSQRDGDRALLDDGPAWQTPQIAAWFPSPPIDALRTLRGKQERFLEVLDAMPRTVCHLDFHPGNLFAAGDDHTIAIDWAFIGIGALGEDAGNLVPDSVLDFHVDPVQLDELYEVVLEGYADGLRAAGWRGSTADLRRAMAASIAAKYGWIAPAMLRIVSEGRPTLNGRATDAALRWWAPTVRFVLERADEVRALT